MSTPIRPGTARKLGLRPPPQKPRALIVIDRPVSEEYLARLLHNFAGAVDLRTGFSVLPAAPTPRRRWWQTLLRP